jgi:peptide-methionine (S)-S-oxide reductase
MDQHDVAIFGGGCFWCTEAVFEQLRGVISVAPGYAGGFTVKPSYEDVCTGETGHAEVIRVTYDPDVLSYEDLLTVFFAAHDPTTLNKQGNDVGTQYRSMIITTTPQQKQEAQAMKERLSADGKKVVTEIVPSSENPFYEAESVHHHYFETHPEQAYCQLIINPKLEKLKHRFAELIK